MNCWLGTGADSWYSSTLINARLRHIIETWLVTSPNQSGMQRKEVVTSPSPESDSAQLPVHLGDLVPRELPKLLWQELRQSWESWRTCTLWGHEKHWQQSSAKCEPGGEEFKSDKVEGTETHSGSCFHSQRCAVSHTFWSQPLDSVWMSKWHTASHALL